MIVFSAVNVILTVLDTGISFLFSATLPMLFAEFGQSMAAEFGLQLYFRLGMGAAIIIIIIFSACYLLSKKYKVLILVALILFVIDTVALGWLLSLGFDAGMIIDIVFHLWVLFSLYNGVSAWKNLKKFNNDETNTDLQPKNPDDNDLEY